MSLLDPSGILANLAMHRQNIFSQSGAPWGGYNLGLPANEHFQRYGQQTPDFQQALELVGPYQGLPRITTPVGLEPGTRTIADPTEFTIPPIYTMPMPEGGIGTGTGTGIGDGGGSGIGGGGDGTGGGTAAGPGGGNVAGPPYEPPPQMVTTPQPYEPPPQVAVSPPSVAPPSTTPQPYEPPPQVAVSPPSVAPPQPYEPPPVDFEAWEAATGQQHPQDPRRRPATDFEAYEARTGSIHPHDPRFVPVIPPFQEEPGVEPPRIPAPEEIAYQEELEAGGGPLAPPPVPLPIEGGGDVGWQQGLPPSMQVPIPVPPVFTGGGGGGSQPVADVPAFFPGTTIEDVVEGTLTEGEGTGSLEIPPTTPEEPGILDTVGGILDQVEPNAGPLNPLPPGINLPIFDRNDIMRNFGDPGQIRDYPTPPAYTPEQSSQWGQQFDSLLTTNFEPERETAGQDPYADLHGFLSDPAVLKWAVDTGRVSQDSPHHGIRAFFDNPATRLYLAALGAGGLTSIGAGSLPGYSAPNIPYESLL